MRETWDIHAHTHVIPHPGRQTDMVVYNNMHYVYSNNIRLHAHAPTLSPKSAFNVPRALRPSPPPPHLHRSLHSHHLPPLPPAGVRTPPVCGCAKIGPISICAPHPAGRRTIAHVSTHTRSTRADEVRGATSGRSCNGRPL